jgi:hypothetical protein
MMGAPVVPVAVPLEPTLPPDIDPVLLVRLYPGATTAGELRTQAMAAGAAVQEQGALLEAEQQDDLVFYEGDGTTPEDRERIRKERAAVRASGAPRPGTPPPVTPPPPHPAPQPPTPPHQPPDKK